MATAGPQARTGAAPQAQGCYKCGQTGHWSRDCTVPQSQWIPRAPPPGGWPARTPGGGTAAAGRTPAAAAAGADDDALNGELPEGDQPAQQAAGGPLRKEKRKRPKVTLELMQSAKGIPDVLANFPDAFKRQYKGRGHEASDLRRLLEMYKRWQDRVFPHGDFDSFICAMERLSGTKAMHHEMHQARMRVLEEVRDVMHPQHVQLEAEEAQAPAGGAAPQLGGMAVAGGLAAAAAALGDDDDDVLELMHPEELDDAELDDELLGLLEEPQQAPAGGYGVRQAGASGAAAMLEDDGDDDLLELLDPEAEAAPAQQAAVQAQAAAAAVPEDEDDDLMELLEEGGNSASAEQAPAVPAADMAAPAAQQDTAAATAAAEEEQQLLALAAGGTQAAPSQSLLPGSTVATGAAVAFVAAAEAGGTEEDDLLDLLEEADAEAQQDGGSGNCGSGAGAAPSQPSEQQPLVQLSPEFGCFTAADAAGSDGGCAGMVAETEEQLQLASQAELEECTEAAASALEASPVLGPDTEVQATGTEEAVAVVGGCGFVPESEPVSDPTQEL